MVGKNLILDLKFESILKHIKNLILFDSGDNVIRNDIKGRLLTPEEGCGQSRYCTNAKTLLKAQSD